MTALMTDAALLDDVQAAFWHAHNEAADLRANLTPAQRAGVQPLPDGLEYWDGEARTAYNALPTVPGIDDDLYARPYAAYDGPTSMSDWTRGRTA